MEEARKKIQRCLKPKAGHPYFCPGKEMLCCVGQMRSEVCIMNCLPANSAELLARAWSSDWAHNGISYLDWQVLAAEPDRRMSAGRRVTACNLCSAAPHVGWFQTVPRPGTAGRKKSRGDFLTDTAQSTGWKSRRIQGQHTGEVCLRQPLRMAASLAEGRWLWIQQ